MERNWIIEVIWTEVLFQSVSQPTRREEASHMTAHEQWVHFRTMGYRITNGYCISDQKQ